MPHVVARTSIIERVQHQKATIRHPINLNVLLGKVVQVVRPETFACSVRSSDLIRERFAIDPGRIPCSCNRFW